MSRLLVTQYQAEVEKLIQYGGSRKETSIRRAFENLLNEYCKPKDFLLVAELDYKLPNGKLVYPDGTIKDALRLDWGYWEAKDEFDNLDVEIEKKLNKGYPDSNILFEDSQTAVLIQSSTETMRVSMRDADAVDGIINNFINFVRPEVRDFREAIGIFSQDLPTILGTLRNLIKCQEGNNILFENARNKFWDICKKSINPEITLLDIQEMIIQHILTEDIFINIFSESQFHQENNVARELQGVISTFFTGSLKRNTLGSIERYYAAIRQKAANIANHKEKQTFLKILYENFYKAYNPKAADRLGIVYTPNEIVRFMIESTDFLVHKHFGKLLADKDVEILDPATGTGTFITELIDYLPKQSLEHKYKHEIHCNEVAILPYYIANLNIEYTYKQKMEKYEEFENICFVDTLDNVPFVDKQLDLFLTSVENTARIKRQNKRKISVIIGNPPYNANQFNENDNNKNRAYLEIDKLIKATYVKESTAQKTKVYDMYSRFFRWATNRLNENGILAFITNSSFINAKGFDGFRKSIVNEFDYIYIIDLGGDIREGDTTGNVFNIITGVAITFMIKIKPKNKLPCQIMYFNTEDFNSAQEKLDFLGETKFDSFAFEHIKPDQQNNWVDLTDNDFEDLVSIADKKDKSIFDVYSNGVATNRDEWVYDIDLENLENKSIFFINEYNYEVQRWVKYKKDEKYKDIKQESNPVLDKFLSERNLIKWSKMIKRDKLRKEKTDIFNREDLRESHYRPFVKRYIYFSYIPIDIKGSQHLFFPDKSSSNQVICFANNEQTDILVLAINTLCDLNFCARGSSCFALYTYDENGNRIDNITEWELQQIQTHYKDTTITKIDIFHYTYAVLHNPAYRTKYELNLKRDFPRLPYYENFQKWVNWGKRLMELHINYETVIPYNLTRFDIPLKDNQKTPKPKLKADKIKGSILLDDVTTLENIPKIAWEYMLGNRCALEWILDQYKEKKPKDTTIAEKFNTYRFADYKEQVIELLMKVCTVSVETMNIIRQME